MKKKWLIGISVGIVIVMLAGTAFYFYNQYQIVSGKNSDREIKQLVTRVGKLMMLPDEVPTLATVTDKTKLNSQKFFKNSENGDKVLIYSLASKAILYRPSKNLIIEVASVTAGDSSINTSKVSPTAAAVPSLTLRVAIYNGTKTVGLTTKYEKIISGSLKDVQVVGKESAANTDYQQTIVVDISKKNPQIVSGVADALGAKVGDLPPGEVKPEADVLIILGKNSI